MPTEPNKKQNFSLLYQLAEETQKCTMFFLPILISENSKLISCEANHNIIHAIAPECIQQKTVKRNNVAKKLMV